MKLLRSCLLSALLLLPPAANLARAEDHSGDVLDEDGTAFMLNAATGLMVHEFGHNLIRDNMILVLGNEETAVDNFVPVLLFQNSEVLSGQERAQVLVDHANSWLYAAKWSSDRLSLEGLSYYDEHETDVRRAYTMMCLMVGGSKSSFGQMASAYGIPDDRQNNCTGTFTAAQLAWNKYLEPAAREDGNPSSVKITYEEAPNYAPYREAVMQGEMLERVAKLVTEKYKLREGTEVTARDCGGRGDGSSKGLSIEICYERVQFYYYLWDKFGRDDATRASVKVDNDFSDNTANGMDEILKEMTPETGDDGGTASDESDEESGDDE